MLRNHVQLQALRFCTLTAENIHGVILVSATELLRHQLLHKDVSAVTRQQEAKQFYLIV